MTPAPGQLDVQWGATGVSVRVKPLRVHPSDRPPWMGSVGLRFLQLSVLGSVVLLGLRAAMGPLPDVIPEAVFGGLLLLAPVVEAAIRWRWEHAELTVEIEPHEVRLIHHLGPFPVVTETIALDTLQRMALEGSTLRFLHQDGRTVSEPLPSLTDEAREWLLGAIQEARDATADFWRDQVGHAAEQSRMRALLEHRSTEREPPGV